MTTYEWLSLIGVLLGGFVVLADKLTKLNVKIAQIEGKLWSTDRIQTEITAAIREHELQCHKGECEKK